MKLGCVNIATTNLDEMKDFYSLILETPYIERNSKRYEIAIDNVCIVLTHTDTKTPINPDCCGLEFYSENVDELYDRLLNAGIVTETAPTTLPWNWRYFSVKDPDGNNIDFTQNLGE